MLNIVKRKAYKKAYREKNKEAISLYNKQYGEKNKEVIRLNRVNRDLLKGKKAIKEERKIDYEKNKVKLLAKARAWAKANKEKKSALNAKYRLLKVNAEAAMSDAEKENYANLVEIRDKATALFGYAWHIDHTIPLSKGGTNAIDNLEVVPALWNEAKGNSNSDSFWG